MAKALGVSGFEAMPTPTESFGEADGCTDDQPAEDADDGGGDTERWDKEDLGDDPGDESGEQADREGDRQGYPQHPQAKFGAGGVTEEDFVGDTADREGDGNAGKEDDFGCGGEPTEVGEENLSNVPANQGGG